MKIFKTCRNHASPLPFTVAFFAILSACAPSQAPIEGESQPSAPREFSFRVVGAGPAAEETAHALAEYGIEFHLTGNFEVGPAPNGQTHKDQLTTEEREQLKQSWAAWLKAGFTTNENCIALDASSELANAKMRVSILQNDREAALIRIDGGQICGPAEAATLDELSKVLFSLAKSHYPRRFPSECLASTDALRAVQESLVSCQSQADCAHVDAQYDVIAPGEVQYVPLKSCSILPRLSAANPALLKASRKVLISARESAKQTCTEESQELLCTTEADVGFQNHRHPARCVANRCIPGKSLN